MERNTGKVRLYKEWLPKWRGTQGRLGYIKRVASQVERNIGKVRLGYIKRVATQVERNIGKVRLY